MIEEFREYIRHPSSIPITFTLRKDEHTSPLKDVGKGGVCFKVSQMLPVGEKIQIQINACKPAFQAEGIVCWCKHYKQGYLVGVTFTDKAVRFAIRMVEQVCYIENYRKQVFAEQGVSISSEQAAMEWIRDHAAQFPIQSDS